MNPLTRGRVAAIILAAGRSQRMGRLKPLLPFGEKPLLARVIETLVTAQNISPIFVVTGHAAQEIAAAVGEYNIRLVHNANYAAGEMLSSVQAGVRALPADCAAFFLVLGDQPMVQPETFRALLSAWRQSDAPLVAPTFEGRRGHPVLFSSRCAADILALPVGETLKTVVARYAAQRREVPVSDPAILADVDTPEDYARALRLWQDQTEQYGSGE
ncbi:MAG TPA: nucleotidyltransferase family protein [Chthonomonadaceae bacterium]|nr:nucleotidyltransferase family protein [Chthonomonadaceae bacterium]